MVSSIIIAEAVSILSDSVNENENSFIQQIFIKNIHDVRGCSVLGLYFSEQIKIPVFMELKF